MGKKHRKPQQEKPKASPETDSALALRKSLSRIPCVPVRLERTLTPAFTREYFQIMTSPEMVDIDWLTLKGELTPEQAMQYADLTGSFGLLSEKMNELAGKMAAHFSTAVLSGMVKNDMKGKSKEGIRNLFQQIENLWLYMPAQHRNKYCAYSFFAKTFNRHLMAFIGSRLLAMGLSARDPEVKEFILGFIDLCDRINRQHDGMEFPGIMLHNELVFYAKTLNEEENIKELDAVIGGGKLTPEEKNALENKHETTLEEIRKEASYKKILLHRFGSGKPDMLFFGDDFQEGGYRYANFCAFRINFNKGFRIGYPKVEKDHFGNTTHDFENLNGIVNCTLNTQSGELSLIVNKAVNLSAVMSPDRYLRLKVYLLEQLRDYLVSKDPDIEDLFAPSVQEQRVKVADEAKSVLPEGVFQGTDPEPETEPEPPSIPEYKPYERPAEEKAADEQPVRIIPADDLKSLPKGKRKVIMDRIWGASGAEAMAAIKRMLDEPVRQVGSHVFFRSPRTNATLPVPNHDKIPPPLIISNLKDWGFSLAEYARELGAKV
jgi:predicted RNA binding protein YcfA (HicA-like mRNA interferase family)